MLSAAGSVPEPGVIVIHCVPSGAIAVVKAAALVPALTAIVWAAGSAAPVTQVNDKAVGVGVSTL